MPATCSRRCGPIWLTFAAAHAVAARRNRPEDWWALAWLRGTELATDVVWSRSVALGVTVRGGVAALLKQLRAPPRGAAR